MTNEVLTDKLNVLLEVKGLKLNNLLYASTYQHDGILSIELDSKKYLNIFIANNAFGNTQQQSLDFGFIAHPEARQIARGDFFFSDRDNQILSSLKNDETITKFDVDYKDNVIHSISIYFGEKYYLFCEMENHGSMNKLAVNFFS